MAVLGGIRFEGIELVLYLSIDVLVLAFGFTALGLNHPHRTVFLHYDVVSIEQPLMLQAVQINDGEILLPGIAILVDPIDIIAALTILLKQLLRCAADEGGGVAGGVLLIGIGKVLDFFLYTGIVFEKILLRDMEQTLLRFKRHAHLLRHSGCDCTELITQLVFVIDNECVEFRRVQVQQLFLGIAALAEQPLQNGFHLAGREADCRLYGVSAVEKLHAVLVCIHALTGPIIGCALRHHVRADKYAMQGLPENLITNNIPIPGKDHPVALLIRTEMVFRYKRIVYAVQHLPLTEAAVIQITELLAGIPSEYLLPSLLAPEITVFILG